MEVDIAARLRDLRTQSGHSQEQLAELLGVTRQAVSKWERGQDIPSVWNLLSLSELYGVSLDYLVTGRAQPPQETAPPPARPIRPLQPLRILLLCLLGFAGVSVIGALFLFLLTLLIP